MSQDVSLADQWACNATIQRFSVYVDAGRYDDAASLFAVDGVLQRPLERIEGRAALLQSFGARPVHRLTRHVISNVLVDAGTGADHLRAHSYVCVYRHLGAPGQRLALPVPSQAPETMAEYVDELVRVDDRWLISHRTVRPIFDVV